MGSSAPQEVAEEKAIDSQEAAAEYDEAMEAEEAAPEEEMPMEAAEEEAAPAAEEAPAEEESFAVAEAAPLPAPEEVPAAGAAPETAQDAEIAEDHLFMAEGLEGESFSEEAAYADSTMMAAANAAAEEPVRDMLCRGENGEPILEGELGAGALRTLLTVEKPAEAPDREPDYVLLLPVTEDRWLLWVENGVLLVREDGTSDAGWTVGAEEFRQMFGLGE